MDSDTPAVPPKVRTYDDVSSLLTKLEGKVAMWERVARDARERADDFERAAQAVRDGCQSVTVGRTTYQVDGTGDAPHTER